MRILGFRYNVRFGTGESGRWRLRLVVMVVAALAANLPGVDGSPGARAEVLTLQGALGALSSVDSQASAARTGVLDIQRLFGASEGADAEDGATVWGATAWATLPPSSRMPAPESAFANTELGEANGDAEQPTIGSEQSPPAQAGNRFRYRYHLLANAPPSGDAPSEHSFTHMN
ncbi:MAG: hypothetical protein KF886_20315 [Candidatus Hydrogenedentes bacterium]|nr:hypothetical protein [Candidatus Hydrogenedentota bacterium]